MKLIFVNELGPNFKGDNIYEFIFSNLDDVWGEDWDAEPAAGKPLPPNINFIKHVGVLKNSEIDLELIQNSDFFGMYDSIDGGHIQFPECFVCGGIEDLSVCIL